MPEVGKHLEQLQANPGKKRGLNQRSCQLHHPRLRVCFICRKCWKNYEPRRLGKHHDWQKTEQQGT